MEQQLLEQQLLEQQLLEQQLLEQQLLEQQLLEQQLLEQPMLEQLIKYSYNHFKGSKQAFNSNLCKSINIVYFGRVAMLECFKSAINKIFILNICKKVLIFKIIIIKIILLINTNVNDIKYQKPQH